jgi:hypothetical protein
MCIFSALPQYRRHTKRLWKCGLQNAADMQLWILKIGHPHFCNSQQGPDLNPLGSEILCLSGAGSRAKRILNLDLILFSDTDLTPIENIIMDVNRSKSGSCQKLRKGSPIFNVHNRSWAVDKRSIQQHWLVIGDQSYSTNCCSAINPTALIVDRWSILQHWLLIGRTLPRKNVTSP